MLSLFYTYGEQVLLKSVIWHIGEEKPEIKGAVYSIQADGHELDYIYSNFGNLPMRFHKRVILYHNPFAQFIWNNL